MSPHKICPKCKVDKPLEAYGRTKFSLDGHRWRCSECERADAKEFRAKNADHVKTRRAVWMEKNREKMRAYKREYAKALYARDPEAILKYSRAWKVANKERAGSYAKEYREQNTEVVATRMRKWRAENKAKLRTYWAKWNPVCNAKRRAFKRNQLCGCCQTDDAKTSMALTYATARKLGMHVDHVKPIAKGGLHCLKNLQLLTPEENMRKGAKWKEAA